MSSQKNISPQKEPTNNRPPERFNPKVLLIFLAILSAMLVLWFSNVSTGAGHQQLSRAVPVPWPGRDLLSERIDLFS